MGRPVSGVHGGFTEQTDPIGLRTDGKWDQLPLRQGAGPKAAAGRPIWGPQGCMANCALGGWAGGAQRTNWSTVASAINPPGHKALSWPLR